MTFDKKIFNGLFDSGAILACPVDHPCFYTPTRLGFFRVRSPLLLGKGDSAEALLAFVRTATDTPALCGKMLYDFCLERQEADPLYDSMCRASLSLLQEDAASSGADLVCGTDSFSWMFSIPLAAAMHKPHLLIGEERLIYNDGPTGRDATDLTGARILMVSELTGRGSVLYKNWLPRISGIGGRVTACYSVLDCLTGGSDRMASDGITVPCMFELTKDFFKKAMDAGYLDAAQYANICAYIEDPIKAMADFTKAHPDYIKKEHANETQTGAS